MTDDTAPKADIEESLFEMYGADIESAENGKWFDFGKTIKIKIRRHKSKKSRKVREALNKPWERVLRTGNLDPDIQDEITTKHIATGIIADWKGVRDRNKKLLDYNADNAIALLTQLPDWRDAIAEIAVGLDNFREEEDKEVEGN